MTQLRLFKKYEVLVDAAIRDQIVYLKIKVQAVQGNKMAAWIIDRADHRMKLGAELMADLGIELTAPEVSPNADNDRMPGEIKGSPSVRARKAWITRRKNLAAAKKKK